MTIQPLVAVAPVRRWIRRTQSAHKERGETLGTFYFVVLFVLVVGGMLHNQLRAIFWPIETNLSALGAAAFAVALPAVLYLLLRRLGPLALSRPATSWLLTAPVSRRRLLVPSLVWTALGAFAAAGLATIAVVGHVAPRPAPVALLATGGAIAGVGLMLLALAAQSGRRWGPWLDRIAYLLLALGLSGLVADAFRPAPAMTAGIGSPGAVVAGLALVVAAFFLLAVRAVGATPADRILDASTTAGTLADSAFGVEPSFVADMIERRYWARRRLKSRHLWSRIPPLTAQDLRILARRPARVLWLTGATTLPALLAHAPHWLLAVAVLAGGMIAAGTTTANVRTDAANPVMLRMLGLSSRQAIGQRFLVPGVLAGLWCAGALSWLHGLGALPAGPWWALGLALAPVGAAAAVRRARVGFVDNGLLPLDTPMGTVSTGPALNLVIGFDLLLLGLPVIVQIVQGVPLTWSGVLVQAAVGAFGARTYVTASTDHDRVDLTKPR